MRQATTAEAFEELRLALAALRMSIVETVLPGFRALAVALSRKALAAEKAGWLSDPGMNHLV